jgi:hypothetical protein
MKIYIAGPMRGLPHFNFPAFKAAALSLRALGHTVFSPADADNDAYGYDVGAANPEGSEAKAIDAGITIRECMARDCKFICEEADAVYMLDGWETSTGAQAEWALARALHLPVIYQNTCDKLDTLFGLEDAA